MGGSFFPEPEMNLVEQIAFPLDGNKSVPAPFLSKTYQLVDDSSTDHIVSWGQDNCTFVVWRPPEFARDVLPNYFKHNNLSSFVRQLNTYGFRKVVPDRWEFANGYFRKGEKHLLCEIQRRKTSSASFDGNHCYPLDGNLFCVPPFSKRQSVSSSHFKSDSDSPPAGGLPFGGPTAAITERASDAISAFSEDNERLRRSNAVLTSELEHMKKLYNDVLFFLQNHVRHFPCHHPAIVTVRSTNSGSATNGGSSSWYSTSGSCAPPGRDSSSKQHSGISFEDELLIPSEAKLFGVPLQRHDNYPAFAFIGPNYSFSCQTDELKLNL